MARVVGGGHQPNRPDLSGIQGGIQQRRQDTMLSVSERLQSEGEYGLAVSALEGDQQAIRYFRQRGMDPSSMVQQTFEWLETSSEVQPDGSTVTTTRPRSTNTRAGVPQGVEVFESWGAKTGSWDHNQKETFRSRRSLPDLVSTQGPPEQQPPPPPGPSPDPPVIDPPDETPVVHTPDPDPPPGPAPVVQDTRVVQPDPPPEETTFDPGVDRHQASMAARGRTVGQEAAYGSNLNADASEAQFAQTPMEPWEEAEYALRTQFAEEVLKPATFEALNVVNPDAVGNIHRRISDAAQAAGYPGGPDGQGTMAGMKRMMQTYVDAFKGAHNGRVPAAVAEAAKAFGITVAEQEAVAPAPRTLGDNLEGVRNSPMLQNGAPAQGHSSAPQWQTPHQMSDQPRASYQGISDPIATLAQAYFSDIQTSIMAGIDDATAEATAPQVSQLVEQSVRDNEAKDTILRNPQTGQAHDLMVFGPISAVATQPEEKEHLRNWESLINSAVTGIETPRDRIAQRMILSSAREARPEVAQQVREAIKNDPELQRHATQAVRELRSPDPYLNYMNQMIQTDPQQAATYWKDAVARYLDIDEQQATTEQARAAGRYTAAMASQLQAQVDDPEYTALQKAKLAAEVKRMEHDNLMMERTWNIVGDPTLAAQAKATLAEYGLTGLELELAERTIDHKVRMSELQVMLMEMQLDMELLGLSGGQQFDMKVLFDILTDKDKSEYLFDESRGGEAMRSTFLNAVSGIVAHNEWFEAQSRNILPNLRSRYQSRTPIERDETGGIVPRVDEDQAAGGASDFLNARGIQ